MMYAVISVEGVKYDLNWYQRYGDRLVVVGSPDLGGIGPFYGLTFEEAETQLLDEIKARMKHGGYLDHGLRWDSRHAKWVVKHGYGKRTEAEMAKGKKPKGKKLEVVHGSPGVSNLPPQKR